MVSGPWRVRFRARVMASRTPKHMPRWSAMRTCIVVFLFPMGRFALPRTSTLFPVNCSAKMGSASGLGTILLHNGLQLLEIARECLPANVGQLAAGLRPPADKLLFDQDVAFLLELLQMNAQVADRHIQSIA